MDGCKGTSDQVWLPWSALISSVIALCQIKYRLASLKESGSCCGRETTREAGETLKFVVLDTRGRSIMEWVRAAGGGVADSLAVACWRENWDKSTHKLSLGEEIDEEPGDEELNTGPRWEEETTSETTKIFSLLGDEHGSWQGNQQGDLNILFTASGNNRRDDKWTSKRERQVWTCTWGMIMIMICR